MVEWGDVWGEWLTGEAIYCYNIKELHPRFRRKTTSNLSGITFGVDKKAERKRGR